MGSVTMHNSSIHQQDQIDEVIREAVKGSGKVNIVVAGKTGVGKSTLINCVFRGELARTGSGKLNRPGFPRHSPSSGNSAFQILLAIAA